MGEKRNLRMIFFNLEKVHDKVPRDVMLCYKKDMYDGVLRY